MPSSLRIDRLSRPVYGDLVRTRPLIIPIGATEQHGVHLPLGTDAMCVTAMAELVSAQVGALVAPTLPYGYRSIPRSGGGEEFPGTTGLSMGTTVAILGELLMQFIEDGSTQICILSGHYENQAAMHEAAFLVTHSRSDVKVMTCLWADVLSTKTLDDVFPSNLTYPGLALEHAAFLETSIMLHLYPELVSDDRALDEKVVHFPPYDIYPTPAMLVPKSGSLAPTSGASGIAGKTIVDECIQKISEIFEMEFGQANGVSKAGGSQ